MISFAAPGIAVHTVNAYQFELITNGKTFPSVAVKRYYNDPLYYATVICVNYGGNNGLEIFHVECKSESQREGVIAIAKRIATTTAPFVASPPADNLIFGRPIAFDE